jgi:DhnA family fructose-bisphosphate aldolase class Ia
MNTGQAIRMREIFDETSKSMILDFTKGLMGVEFRNVKEFISAIDTSIIDAIIVSPGEAKRHNDLLCEKRIPFIIACDWSNRFLDERSAYPAQKFRQVPICGATDALRIGASAVIADVHFGTSDADSTESMQALRLLVDDGNDAGLPVLVNVVPFGSRVSEDNYADVAGLGMRMCLELGATMAAIPLVAAPDASKLVEASMKCPLVVNTATTSPANHVHDVIERFQGMLDAGIRAIILDGFDSRCNLAQIDTMLNIRM